MFQPDPSISFIPATREQVVALIESINQPQISIPGKTSQIVQGYLCGLRNPNATFSIVIVLVLHKSGEKVVYVHDKKQLTLEAYRDVEIEGLHFLESMGFMLDNLNFRNMAPALQDATLQRIPLFSASPPRPSEQPAASQDGRAAKSTQEDVGRLARLLASF